MFVLVTYDIDTRGGKLDLKRMRDVSKFCEKHGIRVQNSVFEMNFDYSSFLFFKQELNSRIDINRDSVRYYILGNSPDNRIEVSGRNDSINVRSALIF